METDQARKQERTQANSQILLSIVFSILAGFLAWLTNHDVQAGLASEKFVSTGGTITSFNDGGGRHVPTFAYGYKVNGTEYLDYLDGYPLPSVPGRKYTVGESVRVFYDPADPSQACLKQGLDQIRVAGLILITFLSFVAAIMAIIATKIKT